MENFIAPESERIRRGPRIVLHFVEQAGEVTLEIGDRKFSPGVAKVRLRRSRVPGTCQEYFGPRYSRNDSRMNRNTCSATFD